MGHSVEVLVYDASKTLQGTISRVLNFETRGALNEIGSGWFEIASDDTESRSLIEKYHVCVIRADLETETDAVLQQFIVLNFYDTLSADGRNIMRVEGPDLLHDLTRRSLGFNTISDGSKGPSTQPIVDITGYADNSWTSFQVGTSSVANYAYLQASGENVFEALLAVINQQAGNVSLVTRGFYPSNALPNYQYFIWYSHNASSLIYDSLTLKSSDTGWTSGEAPILSIRKIEQPRGVATRGWFFGAGMGDERFTLKEMTNSDPTGFTTTAADSYVVHDALETTLSPVVIEIVKQFPSIKPEDPDNSTSVITAANALHDAAIKYLEDNDGSTVTFYEVETILDSHHVVGQRATLTYSRTSPYNSTGNLSDTTIIDVDDDFIILEMRHYWDGRAIRTWMKLGDLTRTAPDGARVLAHKVSDLESVVRHATAGAGTSAGAVGDPTYLRADGSVALSGDLSVGVGVTIDGVDISAANAAPYVTMATNSNLSSERVLMAGDGLDLADGGAGNNATLSVDVTDITGNGLTETSNNIQLGTPGTLAVSSSNSVTSSSHTHAITSSSSPGAAASLLASDANGRLRLTGLGIGRAADANELQLATELGLYSGSTAVLTLGTDAGVGGAGDITLSPDGDLLLDPGGEDVLPGTNYETNLGSISRKYLTLHAAELVVETLVAQDTLATIGGRVLVGPTTTFTRDADSLDTTIYVKHNQMASGDRAYCEAAGKVEFFAITSGPTLEGAGDYSYSVTRDLDGSGANDWFAGDAIFNTGASGDGWIDLYSLSGVSGGTGPAIVGNVRNSATYNDWTEHWAIGNLNGNYGYASDVYGVGLGKYASGAAHITIDDTNGVRIISGTSAVLGQWATNGDFILGQVTSGKANVFWDESTGRLNFRGNTTVQSYIDTDGSFVAGNGDVELNTDGLTVVAGSVLSAQNYVTWRAGGSTDIYRIGADSAGNVYHYGTAAPAFTAVNFSDVDLLTTDGDIEVDGSMKLGTPILSLSTGDFAYSGDLKSWKSSAAYTGYIYVPLSSPLSVTGLNGNSFSDVGSSTALDLNTASSVPADAVAVVADVRVNDSGSWGSGAYYFAAGPSSTNWFQLVSYCYGGDLPGRQLGIINLDASGRIWYRVDASGASTLDVTMYIWGYFI